MFNSENVGQLFSTAGERLPNGSTHNFIMSRPVAVFVGVSAAYFTYQHAKKNIQKENVYLQNFCMEARDKNKRKTPFLLQPFLTACLVGTSFLGFMKFLAHPSEGFGTLGTATVLGMGGYWTAQTEYFHENDLNSQNVVSGCILVASFYASCKK